MNHSSRSNLFWLAGSAADDTDKLRKVNKEPKMTQFRCATGVNYADEVQAANFLKFQLHLICVNSTIIKCLM